VPTDSQRAFTDDKLHAIEMDAEVEIEMNGTYEISGDDFYALLTRLGAAEEIAKGFEMAHLNDENCGCSMCDCLEVWKASRGV